MPVDRRAAARGCARGRWFGGRLLALTIALPCALLLPQHGVAQTNDAAIHLDQQEAQRARERERLLHEQQAPGADVRLPGVKTTDVGRLPATETPCFVIQRIELIDDSGHFAWARAAADPPGDPATGRCLGSQGINLIMARIQNAIVERGYVTTRVLAEAQDLTAGTLALRVIPGRLRSVRFTADSSPRANAWNVFPVRPGQLLNLRDLEQALENFKRLPSAEADLQIVPADAPGESDVVVTWKQAFPLRLTLSANDGGSKATGKYQGSVTLSGDHLLALNDLFYFSYGHDLGGAQQNHSGTDNHSWHYALPFGDWLLGFSANDHAYRQAVAGSNLTYIYRGTSDTREIKLSRLVFRNATQKTTLSLRGYRTASRNYIDDTEIEVQRRRMAGWELSADHRSYLDILPGAVLNANLAYRRGTGAFDALPAPEEDFGEGTARPRLWSAEADFSAPFSIFGQRLTYIGQWRGQWNRSPLVPQDRFSIGGRYTVRGFDGETILSAERGFLVRNELAVPLFESGQQLYLGLDYGRVGGPTAKLLMGRSLTGGVIGLRGGGKGFFYDVFAGKALTKPDGFPTHRVSAGFSLSFTY